MRMVFIKMSRVLNNWNTYSGLCFNRLIKLPEKYELRLAVYMPDQGLYTSQFLFSAEQDSDTGKIERINAHSPYGEYIQQIAIFNGYKFKYSVAASTEGELACRCQPLVCYNKPVKFVLQIEKLWSQDDVMLSGDRVLVSLQDGSVLTIAAGLESHYEEKGVYTAEAELIETLQKGEPLNGINGQGRVAVLLFDGTKPLTIAATQYGDVVFKKVIDVLQDAEREYISTAPASSGIYSGSIESLNTAVNAQVVWDEIHGELYTPVTRRWIDFYLRQMQLDPEVKGPVLGLWDCLFSSVLHSCDNQAAAEGNLKLLFKDDIVTADGYPPNYVAHPVKSGDRSQPPLGSFTAWKLFLKNGNRSFLSQLYPHLVKWHQWWPLARDGNQDGLLEWGSNSDVIAPGNDAGTLFAAKCESGMDNSPLFDEAVFQERSGVMNLNSVFLTSIYASDCLFLTKIAHELGLTDDARGFQKEYDAVRERINRLLWSEKDGIYIDRYWDGSFSQHISPASFFPMMARLASQEQAEQMVKQYLLNEEHFWGEYVFPAISKTDPAFREQNYWRGRIWPPLNYLVYLGLKEYGFDDVAAQVAEKCYRLFMHEWELDGHCHENYNALNGLGCDVRAKAESYDDGFMGNTGSDSFYTWGALLLLPSIEELIDVDLDGGLRFSSIDMPGDSVLKRLRFGGCEYSVNASDEHLEIFKNDKLLLDAVPGVNVRRFKAENGSISCLIKGQGSTLLKLCAFAPQEVIRVNGMGPVFHDIKCNAAGKLLIKLDLDHEYRQFDFTSIKG